MSEQWKVVPFHDSYIVSDHGNVRRIADVKNLRKTFSKEGYPKVAIFDVNQGKYRSIPVHRLVCMAFNGPSPSNKHEVGHIDGSKDNNIPSNLRWVTRKENVADTMKHGRHNKFRQLSLDDKYDISVL